MLLEPYYKHEVFSEIFSFSLFIQGQALFYSFVHDFSILSPGAHWIGGRFRVYFFIILRFSMHS